jgi:hypothetical protein
MHVRKREKRERDKLQCKMPYVDRLSKESLFKKPVTIKVQCSDKRQVNNEDVKVLRKLQRTKRMA